MIRLSRGILLLLFFNFLCFLRAEISECSTSSENPTDCPGCCPLDEGTITLTEWITSTSKCFQTTVVTTTPTKLIRSTVVQAFITTFTTTALFTVTTSVITTITTTEFDTIYIPTTKTYTRTTTAIGSAVITTQTVISATTTFTTTTSILVDKATSTVPSSRSTDLIITIPQTVTSTLVDIITSLAVVDTVQTIFTLEYAFIFTTQNLLTYTLVAITRETLVSNAARPLFYTTSINDIQAVTDTNALTTVWQVTSTLFYTAKTETTFGTTTQTYSRLYGP